MTQITQRAIEGRAIYHQLARIHAESEKVRAGQLSGGAFHTRTARMIDDLTRIAEYHSQQLNADLLAQSTVLHRLKAPDRAGTATESTLMLQIMQQHGGEAAELIDILAEPEEPCPEPAPTETRTPTAPEDAWDVPASC